MIQAHYYQRLARMMAACKHFFFWAALTMIAMAVTMAILPIQIQRILHAAFIEQNESCAQTALLVFIVLIIIYSVSGYVGQYWMRKADKQLVVQLNSALFDKLLHLPVRYCQSVNESHTAQAALHHARLISKTSMQALTVLMRDTLVVAGLIACLFYLNREIAILICLLIPFVFLMFQVITGQQKHYLDAGMQNAEPDNTELAGRLRHCFENFRHIQLLGGQQQECRHFDSTVQSILNSENQQNDYKAFVTMLCQLLIVLITIAMAYLLMQQVIDKTLSIDQAGAFVAIMLLMIMPVSRLAGVSRVPGLMQRQLEQLFLLLDLPAASAHGTVSLTEVRGELTLNQVHVQCSKKVFCRPYTLDLIIRPGETIALVVDDGAARLLLMDLLLGFSLPAAGEIKLDGQDYGQIRRCDLLAQFAVISGIPVILNDRIAGNIAYGDTGCAHEAGIMQAIQATGVADFVRDMPEGLQTRIDDSGASLTRKQWQLVAVARAFLRNPPILIIDDLWPRHAQELADDVFKALAVVMRNRTTILLLPVMPTCREGIDRILLLETGEIVIPGEPSESQR
ncbi:MAG: ATP-binding cassette domain-containing protein [Nitrosomonas sp.]|jgi:subfamily B ATP-binding cassette protein MsbA|nr:ATP-binding cassette domain-containing protein [Nitrosomonas sp.]